jgi:hypothetical protein
VLCGVCIAGFTSSVFLDVVTRTFGAPFLWLQLVTTGFFAWGVFIGMAVATRRIDHLNLVEITKRMSGTARTFLETFNRLVILSVALAMLVFGAFSRAMFASLPIYVVFFVAIAFTVLFPDIVLFLPKLLLPESVGCFKNPSGPGYICPP